MASEEETIGDDDVTEDKTVDKQESGVKAEAMDFNELPGNSVSNNSIEDKNCEQLPSTSMDSEAGYICCELCGVTFTSAVYRDEHRRLCRGQRRFPQLVEPLSVPTDIQDLATFKDGKKIYCCSLCVYTTPRGGHMTRHLLSHMGARPFICIFCGKGFTQGAGLAHHIRIHSGDKPYRCDECDFACGRAIALKRHKNTHTREVMFACTHCDYATSQTYNLKVHLRTHSGERPYKCAQCDYRAGSTCAMRKHERNKHTPKLPCAACPRKFLNQEKLDKHIIKKHTMTDVKKVKIKRTKIKRAVGRPKKNAATDDKSDSITNEDCNVTPDQIDLVTPVSSYTSTADENERITFNTTDSFKCIPNETLSPEKGVAVAPDNSKVGTLDQEGPEEMHVSTNS